MKMGDNDVPTLRANHAIGNDMAMPKTTHMTRIHFQNLNGVSLRKGGTWEQCCEQWQEMEVDVVLSCKHKIDTNHGSNLSTMHQQATCILGQSSFKFKVASTPTTGRRFDAKSGGTMEMVIGQCKGRILSKYKDPAGRWVSISFKRTQMSPVTVISTYQVVNVDPTTVGDSTYANQLAGYYTLQNQVDPHRLRKHHSDDLLQYVRSLQACGQSIVLAGDLNESLGDDPDGMLRLVSECQLFDAIADKHGPLHSTTYQ